MEGAMAIVDFKKEKNTGIIIMNNGENRHNLDFAKCMRDRLAEVRGDASISSVVLASADEKNFSQGIDVGWLMGRMQAKDNDSIKEFMYAMNGVFKELMLIPVPVIAAINGHAYGNGAIISCACDFRFMRADKGFFCFPEVNLGIPFLPGMLAFVQKAIPKAKFTEMYYSGNRYGAAELEQHQIIRKACAGKDELMQESLGFAATFEKKRGIFGEMKKRLHKSIIEVMDGEDKPFIESLFLMVGD
jgi:enoyl-CoA hydratase/carnithine racemase